MPVDKVYNEKRNQPGGNLNGGSPALFHIKKKEKKREKETIPVRSYITPRRTVYIPVLWDVNQVTSSAVYTGPCSELSFLLLTLPILYSLSLPRKSWRRASSPRF